MFKTAFSFLGDALSDATIAASRRIDNASALITKGKPITVLNSNKTVYGKPFIVDHYEKYSNEEAAKIMGEARKGAFNDFKGSMKGSFDNRISNSKIGEKIKADDDGNYSNWQRARSLMYHQDGSLAAGRIAGIAGVTGGVGIAGLAAAKGGYDTVFGGRN